MGFSGCSTNESPPAQNHPLSTLKCFLMGSGSSPQTREIFTPPFSKTPPFSMTRVRPPPPPSRSQLSSRNVDLPSISSIEEQMSSWRLLMYLEKLFLIIDMVY